MARIIVMKLIYSLFVIVSYKNIVDATAEWTAKPYPFYNPAYGNSIEMSCIVDKRFIGFFFNQRKLFDDNHYTLIVENAGEGKTQWTLKINRVTEDDYGKYYCNDSDSSVSADLHIQASIPELLKEQKLVTEEAGIVKALVYGMPKSIITWEFSANDGKNWTKIAELDPSGKQIHGTERYIVSSKGQLTIKNVLLTDAGVYQVSTRSVSSGSIKQTTKVLTGSKPVLKLSPELIYNTTQGLNLEIPCEWMYIEGYPEWLFTDRNGKITQIIQGFNATGLTLTNVTQANEGNYTCKAGNSYANMSTTTRLYPVIIPAEIVSEFKNDSISEKSEYNLTCEATGIPLPTVILSKINAQNLQVGKGKVVHTFKSISLSDKDSYICQANNGAKTATGSSRYAVRVKTLDVLTRPTINLVNTSSIVYSAIGLSFAVKCSADSNPLPKVVLLKNNSDISTRNETKHGFVTSYFEVSNATESDFGDIECVASNLVGRNGTIIKVNQVVKPSMVSHSVIASKSSEVQIKWMKPSNINDEVIVYTITWCEINNDTTASQACDKRNTQDTRLGLGNLKPSTEYSVSITAQNQGVLGDPAKFTFVSDAATTNPPAPSGKSKSRLSAASVAGVIIAVILIILIVVDLFCCYFNHCGFSHCFFETLCASKNTKKYAPTDNKEEELKELKELKPNGGETETV